ncbi:MAG TPA: YfhO family protein [Thermoanaerobaculia bacterium]|nr:YfhO family protein [Thermoanaerobaculia bacterium]
MSFSCNPALPLLALLAAAGPVVVAWRPAAGGAKPGPGRGLSAWRELGIPWAVLGLAGMGLLAPALALPTGIPSPAAALAGVPPWHEAAGQAAAAHDAGQERGNPLLRDVTYQIQPWLLFTRQELRAGRLPVWNPHQFAGSPFWANGQSAPLFPLHLLFTILPLQLGFVLLPWLRLVIGGCGVWMLARELDLGLLAALVAALTFALSGMPVSFALFPMGNALALVPWVLWAVERLAAAGGGAARGSGAVTRAMLPAVAALAAAAGLQLLAGHPETAAHTALLSLIYLAVRGAARPVAAWLGWAAGWLAATALAAVQLLPLAFILPHTSRWQEAQAGAEPPLGLLLQQPLRLVLPELYGHPAHGTWWGPFNYSATAVYAGALALPLAAAGLARAWQLRSAMAPPTSSPAAGPPGVAGLPPGAASAARDRRWLALAVTAAFAFAAAYHWPVVRDLLGALPVLGRAAHHRLLFGVELGLALLAGAGCDEWLAGRGRGILAGGAAAAALLAAAWALHRAAWAAHGLLAVEAVWTAAVAAASLLLALSLRLDRDWRFRLAPLLPALALCDLLAAHGAINPGLPLARLYPPTGAVRFLSGQPERVAGVGEALRPNAAMVYGLYDLRGDDPVKLVTYEAVYRQFAAGDPVYFQPVSRWSSAWLDRLAVRWVVAGPAEAAPAAGWRLAYAGSDARVYRRPTPLPLVRWAPPPGPLGSPPADPTVLRREPGRWKIAWRSAQARLLVVAESWTPGWRAWVDGQARPVEPAAGALLGVWLGPGAGRVELRYRPPGLRVGSALSVAALLALVAVPFAGGRSRPGGAGAGSAGASAGGPAPEGGLAGAGMDRGQRGKRGGRDGADGSRRGRSEITVRPTEEGDLPGLSALFAARFGHPLLAEEWTWKYRQLPGEARSLVAVDAGGAVLAHGGALRLAARWRGGEGGIWQLVDFVGGSGGGSMLPSLVALGRQLLADLPREADAPWIFGFPSDRHFRLGERVFGYQPLAVLTPLAGLLPQGPPGGDAGGARPAAGAFPAISAAAGAVAASGDAGSETGLWSGDSCGDWAEAIWERCAVLGVRRSAAFLNWRYWARPHRYYRFYRLRQRGAEGLAVFAFVGEEAWATELWLPAVGEWYSPMLAVAADLRAAGLRTWRFWPPPPAAPSTGAAAAAAGTAGTALGEGTAGTALPDLTDLSRGAAGDSEIGGLLARLGVQPDGEPRFVGCRGPAHGGTDPVAAAGGFFYAMGDYDLA